MKTLSKQLAALLLATAALLPTACSTTNFPVPATENLERNKYFPDPRLGFPDAAPAVAKKFDKAMFYLAQGRTPEAERRFAELAKSNPEYRPALLALARMAYDRADLDQARQLVEQSIEGIEPFTAAELYAAEIALAQGDRRTAFNLYRRLVTREGVPATVAERHEQLQKELFDELFARANREEATQSIATLREALTIRESEPARILLARRLADEKQFDEARRTIDPLLARVADRDDVQELLADIDLSRNDYQSAITRLERLVRKNPSATYKTKLSEAKELFNAANMPPQYRKAFESYAITRADLAVLTYWKLSPVRFASNPGQPPIAVDIANIPGREELVRSLALGILQVDPITRTVDPNRTVTMNSFIRVAARLLALRGVPACAASVANESNELLRAQRSLESCGVNLATLRANPDGGISGRYAAEVFETIERVLAK